MTQTDRARTDRAPTDHLAWRRLAVAPALALVAVALLWNGAALAVDASPLEQRIDSWGAWHSAP